MPVCLTIEHLTTVHVHHQWLGLEEASSLKEADPKPSPSKEKAAPTWTSFADGYFESSFESPFSEELSEPDEQSLSSESLVEGDSVIKSEREGVTESEVGVSITESPSDSLSGTSPTGHAQKVDGSEQSDHASSDTTPDRYSMCCYSCLCFNHGPHY